MIDLDKEIEIYQESNYCDVIMSIMKIHKQLSLSKLIIFAYIVNRENVLSNSNYFKLHRKNKLTKYLSKIAGNFQNLLNSYEYILKTINLLIKNNIVTFTNDNIIWNEKFNLTRTYTNINNFANKVIQESKKLSDTQFMEEVLYNV